MQPVFLPWVRSLKCSQAEMLSYCYNKISKWHGKDMKKILRHLSFSFAKKKRILRGVIYCQAKLVRSYCKIHAKHGNFKLKRNIFPTIFFVTLYNSNARSRDICTLFIIAMTKFIANANATLAECKELEILPHAKKIPLIHHHLFVQLYRIWFWRENPSKVRVNWLQ